MANGQNGLNVWKFVAPEFVFGPETRYLAGRYARNFGLRKVLVVAIPELARKAMKHVCMATNPRQPSQRDVEVIFEEAL